MLWLDGEVDGIEVTLANDGGAPGDFTGARLSFNGEAREAWGSLTVVPGGGRANQTLTLRFGQDPLPPGDLDVVARFEVVGAPPVEATARVRRGFEVLSVEPLGWDEHGLTGVNVTVRATGDGPTWVGSVDWGLRAHRDEPFLQGPHLLDPSPAPRTFTFPRGEFAQVFTAVGPERLDATVYDAHGRVLGTAEKELPPAGLRLRSVTLGFDGCPRFCRVTAASVQWEPVSTTPAYVHGMRLAFGGEERAVRYLEPTMVAALADAPLETLLFPEPGATTLTLDVSGTNDVPLAAARVAIVVENGTRTYRV